MLSRLCVPGIILISAIALMAALGPLRSASAQSTAAQPQATSAAPHGLEDEQRLREQHEKQFRREHSDASGCYRPDLLPKGVEHTQRMKVAPSIGASPTPSAVQPKPDSIR